MITTATINNFPAMVRNNRSLRTVPRAVNPARVRAIANSYAVSWLQANNQQSPAFRPLFALSLPR